MKKIILAPTLLIGLTVNGAVATKPMVAEIYDSYKKGDYTSSISKLDELNKVVKCWGTAYYWKGMCYMKLQRYTEANEAFEKALSCKAIPTTLHYDYGQTLYAANQLEKSRTRFQKSIELGKQIPTSKYYVANISEMLEEYPLALENYQYLADLENDEENKPLKQLAMFQIAKIKAINAESMEEEKATDYIEDDVIPYMNKAYRVNKDAPLAADIKQEMGQLASRYKVNGGTFKNGRSIPEKKFFIRAAETFSYDSNVLQMSDDASNATDTDTGAFYSRTEASGRYTFYMFRRMTVAPDLKLMFTEYFDDTNAQIYSNNSYTITPALKNSFEHMMFGKPSTLSFDVDYAYFAKDYNQAKKREHYTNTITVSLGESFDYFDFGPSTVTLKYKQVQGYTASLDSNTPTLALNQSYNLPLQRVLSFGFNYDMYNASTSASSSASYNLTADYIHPALFEKVRLMANMSLTMTDTKEQSETRGTELTISPSAKLVRAFGPIVGNLSYQYTTKSSKDENYTYSQHALTMLLEARF